LADEEAALAKKKRQQKIDRLEVRPRKRRSCLELKELKVYKPIHRSSQADVAKMRKLAEYLQQTHKEVEDKFQGWHYFSEKQINFARAYAQLGRRSLTAAAKKAGYTAAEDNIAYIAAARNMKRPGMEELIQAFEREEVARMTITVQEVVKWFNDIATAAMGSGDFTNANRAMENLAKYLQMFVERKEITHRVVHNKEELDARIAELTKVLQDSAEDIKSSIKMS
jgi:phage terminase small subunit